MIYREQSDRNGNVYRIRDAAPEDAPVIVEILTQVGQEGIYIANEGLYMSAEQQAQVVERRNPDLHLILVAERGFEVVGTLEMVRGVFQKNRHTANFGMALVPVARGHGIGEGLLLSAHRWARDLGIQKIGLSVFATNQAAIRLYQRLGYQEEGRRQNQFVLQGTYVDEVLMATYLEATRAT